MKLGEFKVTPCLSKILSERGITQLQLQDMSGVPQASISRFDSNKRHEATHLFAISTALNLKIEQLFTVK
jgi:transcriptional regulator with XRE-family HTH domain